MKKEWILNEEQLKRRKNSRLKSMGSNASMDPMSPIQQHPSRSEPSPMLHSPLPPLPALLSRTQSVDENIVKREPIDQPIHNQLSTTQHQLVNQQQAPAFMNPLQMADVRMLNENPNGNNAAFQQLLTSAANQPGFLPLLTQYGRMPQMMPQQQIKSPAIERVNSLKFRTYSLPFLANGTNTI